MRGVIKGISFSDLSIYMLLVLDYRGNSNEFAQHMIKKKYTEVNGLYLKTQKLLECCLKGKCVVLWWNTVSGQE